MRTNITQHSKIFIASACKIFTMLLCVQGFKKVGIKTFVLFLTILLACNSCNKKDENHPEGAKDPTLEQGGEATSEVGGAPPAGGEATPEAESEPANMNPAASEETEEALAACIEAIEKAREFHSAYETAQEEFDQAFDNWGTVQHEWERAIMSQIAIKNELERTGDNAAVMEATSELTRLSEEWKTKSNRAKAATDAASDKRDKANNAYRIAYGEQRDTCQKLPYDIRPPLFSPYVTVLGIRIWSL